jgi:hypothetical protein
MCEINSFAIVYFFFDDRIYQHEIWGRVLTLGSMSV